MRPQVYFLFILYLRVSCANDSAGAHNKTKPLNSPQTCTDRCLRKCCKANQIFVVSTGACVADHHHQLKKAGWSEYHSQFQIIHDGQCPDLSIVLNMSAGVEYDIFPNGSMSAINQLFTYDQYCLDVMAEDGSLAPLICYEAVRSADPAENLVFLFYKIGLAISILFLSITLGLYLATPQLRKKVHDKCFLCHVVTLIIGFASLISIQNITPENSACAFLGYMSQFWLLASFFWLNIMCIDMWRAVGSVQTIKQSNVRKLLLYCLYAWGCPCLILLFSLSADNFLPKEHYLRTGFAEETCWFRRNKGNNSWVDPRYVHFYGFVSITLIINIYTFVDTALIIKFQNKCWKENHNADSKRHKTQNNRFILYLKLFIVMGLYWMMEVISYHSDAETTFWHIVDCINTLQGFFIFVIFICNKRALRILNKRFFPRRVFLKQYTRTLSERNRSTCSKTSKTSVCEDNTTTTSTLGRTNGGQKLNNLSDKSEVFL